MSIFEEVAEKHQQITEFLEQLPEEPPHNVVTTMSMLIRALNGLAETTDYLIAKKPLHWQERLESVMEEFRRIAALLHETCEAEIARQLVKTSENLLK